MTVIMLEVVFACYPDDEKYITGCSEYNRL